MVAAFAASDAGKQLFGDKQGEVVSHAQALKAEGIEPTDEEIDKELSRFAEQGKKTLEEFKKDMPEGDLEYFKEVASINKTVKFLKDNAGKE